MFLNISLCVRPLIDDDGPAPLNWGGGAADVISGLALIILGALGASGTLVLSPAAAYAMLAVGLLQVAPYLLLSTAMGSSALGEKIKEA